MILLTVAENKHRINQRNKSKLERIKKRLKDPSDSEVSELLKGKLKLITKVFKKTQTDILSRESVKSNQTRLSSVIALHTHLDGISQRMKRDESYIIHSGPVTKLKPDMMVNAFLRLVKIDIIRRQGKSATCLSANL